VTFFLKGEFMLSASRTFVAVLATMALAGCAGTDFVRPANETLRNGQTSYSQVIGQMGQPRDQGAVVKNEKTLKSISYAYASTGGRGLKEGVVPARAMLFYFHNDILAGYEFVSSWAEDNTDFDSKKINSIVKGKTTRTEVIKLLGKPSGFYVYPMIKSQTGEAAAYVYSDARGSAFNMKFFRKALVVSFDAANIATEVEFSSAGVE
jgi:outer membrane protein assembly factor BamE (lipoprotein component of BamABCDE complex)